MRSFISSTALALAVVVGLPGCGRQEPPPAATAASSAIPAPDVASVPVASPAPAVAVADNAVGKSTFNKVCALCHAAGVGGAPKPGDKADWGPRIAQGDEVLFKHALEGFTGAKGTMPPRGGSPALTDEEVKAAVTHMTSLSR